MTRNDIVHKIKEHTIDLKKSEIDAVISQFLNVIKVKLVEGETIYLRGFGTFKTKIRRERTARNLKTNEKIVVPEHKVPYFQIGKDLKVIKMRNKWK